MLSKIKVILFAKISHNKTLKVDNFKKLSKPKNFNSLNL